MSFRDLTKKAVAALKPNQTEEPAKKPDTETSKAEAKQQKPKSKNS